METDKTILGIRKTLQNRELQVSGSAWERLELQLDNHQKSTRKRNLQIFGYAATVACLIATISILLLRPSEALDRISLPKYSVAPAIRIDIPENAIPQTLATPQVAIAKMEGTTYNKPAQITKKEVVTEVAMTSKPASTAIVAETRPETVQKEQEKKPLYINSSKLLASVANPKTNIQETSNPQISVASTPDSLKTVTPNVLLSEVEEEINDDTFKKTFVKRLSGSINTFATAFAERNKSE